MIHYDLDLSDCQLDPEESQELKERQKQEKEAQEKEDKETLARGYGIISRNCADLERREHKKREFDVIKI